MEFQGDFEFVIETQNEQGLKTQTVETSAFDALSLGILNSAKVGKDQFELSVGNHSIIGKLVKLERPLIFTQKVENDSRQFEY